MHQRNLGSEEFVQLGRGAIFFGLGSDAIGQPLSIFITRSGGLPIPGRQLSGSNNDTTDPASVMPFSSERAYAARGAVREWANYAPASISLDEFLNVWLPGMSEDGFLVGTNWNAYLVGKECDPTELRDELLASFHNVT